METEEQFFTLIQAGLWGKNVYARDFPPESTQWDEIYRLSVQQTLIGIVHDGIVKLPVENRPPKELLMKWYVAVIRIEQQNVATNKILKEVFELYRAEGLHPILIKGQGVAQNYPDPLKRQCGDIDIYFAGDEYERANKLLQEHGGEPEEESYHHRQFHYKDIAIENHKMIVFRYRKAHQRYLMRLVNNLSTRSLQIGDVEVTVPEPQLDALILLIHIHKHLLSGGIGLRQACDWVMLLHKYCDDIDNTQLWIDFRALGFGRVWRIFSYIGVDYLGMQGDEMPFYTTRYYKAGNWIVDQMLREGNFGKYDIKRNGRPKNYWASKFFSFRLMMNRMYKLSCYMPEEVYNYLFHFQLVRSFKGIIKDKL